MSAREVEAAYCDQCGEALVGRDHEGCRDRRELEPPRYCPLCRRRMIVQVVPLGWTARCSVHGGFDKLKRRREDDEHGTR